MFDLNKIKNSIQSRDRYTYQIDRLRSEQKGTVCIETAVNGSIENLKRNNRSFVIYGEPQSGKTEMMICLTSKLLEEKFKIIILLLNDNVELLNQNLGRFTDSNISPSPKNYSEILEPSVTIGTNEWVIFCKKNSGDLQKLINKIGSYENKVIIDDEADYASPNSKINKGDKTKINALIEKLLGSNGVYIGVTATPARLDLNNTFSNNSQNWVDFPAHSNYTGQEVFFPTDLDKPSKFQLRIMPDVGDDPKWLRDAIFSFIVNVSYLNEIENDGVESNYSMLIHTSGKVADHSVDHIQVQKIFDALYTDTNKNYIKYWESVWTIANERYPLKADLILNYAIQNISRNKFVLMNSDSDKKFVDFKGATKPSTPFTVAIGGNIISRGVTFENLLTMFFTRDVKHKIQQDTYIQRARMFGSRGKYLKYFELHIPEELYLNWHRCFVFHRLSIQSIRAGRGAPTWMGDHKVTPVSASSIDKTNVDFDSGEMSFLKFQMKPEIESIVNSISMSQTEKLHQIFDLLGDDCLPQHLLDFIKHFSPNGDNSIAVHQSVYVTGYKDADQENIARSRGFMGQRDMERDKFPYGIHHFKIFKNEAGEGRIFYKYDAKIKFFRNLKNQNYD